jgi:hypothetical protein
MKKNIKNRLTEVDIRRAVYGETAKEVLQAIKNSEKGLPLRVAGPKHAEFFDVIANYFDYHTYKRLSMEAKIKIFLKL